MTIHLINFMIFSNKTFIINTTNTLKLNKNFNKLKIKYNLDKITLKYFLKYNQNINLKIKNIKLH